MTSVEHIEAARRIDDANRRSRLYWQDRELWRKRCNIAAIMAVLLGLTALVLGVVVVGCREIKPQMATWGEVGK